MKKALSCLLTLAFLSLAAHATDGEEGSVSFTSAGGSYTGVRHLLFNGRPDYAEAADSEFRADLKVDQNGRPSIVWPAGYDLIGHLGGKLRNPLCGSKVGALKSVRSKGNRETVATFAFDPAKCPERGQGDLTVDIIYDSDGQVKKMILSIERFHLDDPLNHKADFQHIDRSWEAVLTPSENQGAGSQTAGIQTNQAGPGIQ